MTDAHQDTSDDAIHLTSEEEVEDLAFDIGTAQSLLSNAAIARGALPLVSLDLLVGELSRRGHQVCLHQLCRLTKQRMVSWHEMTEDKIPFAADRLPPGYPKLADEDIPFNGDDRRD